MSIHKPDGTTEHYLSKPVARTKAEPVIASDLKPGDLFSTEGDRYWNLAMDHGSCGECVYIRTNTGADRFGDADTTVYRITIEVE